MWELDYRERWVPKNWCVWIVVLENTLESPLNCKEIQPVHHPNQSISLGCSLGGLMLKLKLQYFGHLMWRADSFEKTLMLGKIEGRWTRGRQVEWHHQLNGHEFWGTPGVGDGQGGLVCWDSWGLKESDTTERLNWIELNLPWFMDLTFWVPMQCCSLQHWTLLPSPVTSTTGWYFCFGSISSFFMELFFQKFLLQ